MDSIHHHRQKAPPPPPPQQQQQRQGRPRPQQKRRPRSFRLVKYLRALYWCLIFPTLIFMAYSSLLEMLTISNSINDYNRVALNNDNVSSPLSLSDLLQEQSHQEDPTSPKFHDFNRQAYQSGIRGLIPGLKGGSGSTATSSYGTPNHVYDQQQSSSSWWDQTIGGEQNNKPSYPMFLVQLEKARLAMMEDLPTTTDINKNISSVSSNRSSASSSKWPLATPAVDQPVNFTSPILSLPTKHLFIDINNNSSSSSSSSRSNILVMVLSSPDNFIRRQAIRETWASDTNNVVFVVGQVNVAKCNNDDGNSENNVDDITSCITQQESLQQFLIREQTIYNDILEVPFIDSYKLLPEKVVQMYQYVVSINKKQQNNQIHWLIKADDDTYVRPKVIEKYLKKYNSHIPMLIGKIVPHSLVSRSGKWAEHAYDKRHYPYWPQGSAGHIVSIKIADYITKHSQILHRYQGEDVSIGIWLDESQSQSQQQQLDDLTYVQASRMITNGGTEHCGVAKYIMIGHDLNPEEMYDCHMKFEQINHTTFVDDNAWLDDPAEWKQQILEEEELENNVWGGGSWGSWGGGGGGGGGGESNDDLENNDFLGIMTPPPTQEQ